ncbi:helix-turn-helix domain-containing protein [Silvanigrella sp.]|jgi:transcriptional regulator with XRE-family HTH domain|uniref:helix-turn-helix domain-containing protein n=1 Tax=Silvanigrella sp. TaxID=2024976 RepID=UPI0037C7F4A1
MSFAKTLKEIRKTKGLKQFQLANIIGISESAISLYESGSRLPNLDILVKISNSLNISCDYLLGIKTENNDIFKSLKESDKNVVLKLIEVLKKDLI